LQCRCRQTGTVERLGIREKRAVSLFFDVPQNFAHPFFYVGAGSFSAREQVL
jgi:hypothetical protein